MSYAKGTSVSPEKTRSEIETLLSKMGARKFGVMTDHDRALAVVYFNLKGRDYQLEVPLPKPSEFPDPSKADWNQPNGIKCPSSWNRVVRAEWVRKAIEQATRERWRAVLLLLKAKLELVELGVRSVEEEFMADIVTGNGMRLHTALIAAQQMPPLLPAG